MAQTISHNQKHRSEKSEKLRHDCNNYNETKKKKTQSLQTQAQTQNSN